MWFSNQYSHLLKRVDFDMIVAHLALTHIIKSKAELATTRIKRLLELIRLYSFNRYYIKGKDMILSVFLSDRHMTIVIHVTLFQYPLICIPYYMRNIIIKERRTDVYSTRCVCK